ncbi:O-antigen polymerase [Photobacterium leiognathi]|uniref:O-antigen polymerase n=1 Tax=Photobacterium leiognathi TaxID=553611 RepID=UPI002980FE1B|nr:O-antigen polymerase [Photobacterium leiognathi]
MMDDIKRRLVTCVIVILYMALISISYVQYVYPAYGYMGFPVGKNIDFPFLIISAIFLSIVSFLVLPSDIFKPTDLLITITFWLIILPSVSLIPVISTSDIYRKILTVLIFSLVLIIMKSISMIKISMKFGMSEKYFAPIFYTFFVINMCLIIYYYRVNIDSFLSMTSIKDLYNIRMTFRGDNNETPKLVEYLFFASSKVFIPFLFIKGLENKSKTILILAFSCQMYLFLVTGSKSIFLGLFLVYVLWLFFHKYKKITSLSFSLLIFSVIFVSYSLFLIGYDQVINVIGRRAIIIPGMLTNVYLDFFSEHNFGFLGYSIFSKIVHYTYNTDPAFVIGKNVFERPEMSANVNYIGSSFADFGYWGVIVFTFLATLLYKFFDACFYNTKDKVMILSLLILPTWVLVDGSLITAMTTHGLLWIFFIFMFYPKGEESDK